MKPIYESQGNEKEKIKRNLEKERLKSKGE